MTIGATNFPGSLDSLTELIRAVNDASTTIDTGGATSGATTINVVSAANAPADGKALIVDASDASIYEIVTFTGKTATSITGVTRNVEGSGAKAWDAGDLVYFDGITALNHNVLAAALIAVETKLGSGAGAPASGEALMGSGAGISDWRGITLADVSDVTASAAEVNVLDGITASTTELNYTDGVTSAIQTQLNNKQPLDSDLTTLAANITAAGHALVDDADAAAQRTTLGLTAGGAGDIWVEKGGDTMTGVLRNTTLAGTGDRLVQADADGDLSAGIRILTGSTTTDPGNIAAGSSYSATVTVIGAAVGDICLPCAHSGMPSGWDCDMVSVSAADTVRCVFRNNTGGSSNPASGTLRAVVLKLP